MTFRLPRFERTIELVGKDGRPSVAFHRWWQSTITAIEAQEASQDALLAAIQQAQADIIAAQEDLAAQLLLIQAAQTTADTVTTANAISASWIVPASPLAATDAGSDTTITIANFTRYYDDQTSVAVTGAAITALAYSTAYAVYYDDETRASTTPVFHATTVLGEARHNYVAGRHYLGTITTPAAGGSGTAGDDYTPPGGGIPSF